MEKAPVQGEHYKTGKRGQGPLQTGREKRIREGLQIGRKVILGKKDEEPDKSGLKCGERWEGVPKERPQKGKKWCGRSHEKGCDSKTRHGMRTKEKGHTTVEDPGKRTEAGGVTPGPPVEKSCKGQTKRKRTSKGPCLETWRAKVRKNRGGGVG